MSKRHQRISFKQRVSVVIKWSIYLRNISYACIIVHIVFNSFHFLFEQTVINCSGVQKLILPFCLKHLLRRVWNEIFRTLLESTSEISLGNCKHGWRLVQSFFFRCYFIRFYIKLNQIFLVKLLFWPINYDCPNSILCRWNRWCYKNTIRIKNVLTSICNSWSVFREGGTKFVPLETRLHIVNFS